MSKIHSLHAYSVLDSRGNPTVALRLTTDSHHTVTAMVPSGASTGSKEALELRDSQSPDYHGKGVEQACKNVNEIIAQELIGKDVCEQAALDRLLCEIDGTEDKSRLGANAILGVSLALAKAAAACQNLQLFQWIGELSKTKNFSLPVPMINILNGGEHADNPLSIQEFMIAPSGFASFRQALRASSEVYQGLKKILKQSNLATAVGDEGGFAPHIASTEESLKLIQQAISSQGYTPIDEIQLALDCAASEFYQDGKYVLEEEGKSLSSQEMASWLLDLSARYGIYSLEDPMHETDFAGWVAITTAITKSATKSQIVGDDLFVTNPKILKQGIQESWGNAILIKVNQIGSLSETLECIALAKKHNYKAIISHRSGETEDTFIADLAVGTNAGQIKTGAPCRSERTAKYNRLLEIDELTSHSLAYNSLKI